MDPITVASTAIAVAGAGAAWRLRHRACRAEAQAARLHRELQAERHAASRDPLTGLLNRRAFYERGAALVTDAGDDCLIAIVVDLDDFKKVNDVFGHVAGDDVLIMMAQRLTRYAGDHLTARLGGDEFAALLAAPVVDVLRLDLAARELAELLAAPIPVAGNSVIVTASVGFALAHTCASLTEAVRRADAAMYHVKNSRRACLPHGSSSNSRFPGDVAAAVASLARSPFPHIDPATLAPMAPGPTH